MSLDDSGASQWAHSRVDPFTFEILRKAFSAVCNEMALVIAKTAYSTAVNEARDFCGTVFDANGGQVSQGDFDLPSFVGLSQLTVPVVMEQIGIESMKPGDVYMVNDPYVATTHCNDIHCVKPVFFASELVGFVASAAHWTDVGGSAPGSMNSSALSCYEEGIRIPPITICRGGEFQTDILRLFWANMRISWEREGDFNAQMAALRAGEMRLLSLFEKYGVDTVSACMADVQAYSERLMRSHLAEIPDGTYYGGDRCDQDPVTGEPKDIRVKLIVDGGQATFDFTESDDKALGGINCTKPATFSATVIALKSFFPDVPMNTGVQRAVTILIRPGSIVWAQEPSAVSGLAATTFEAAVSAAQMALGRTNAQRAVGLPFSELNTVYGGFDPRPGFESHYLSYVWCFGGLGGCADHDGASVIGSIYLASTYTIPTELQERRYPLLWERYEFKPDSGGPGKFRGGLGCYQEMSYPYGDGTLTVIGDAERFGPPGVLGGRPGATAGAFVNLGTDSERHIGIFAVAAPVRTGDSYHFWSAGGGGYGDPMERDPRLVLEDVVNELVSIRAAAEDYGVVIRAVDKRRLVFEIDKEATASLRTREDQLPRDAQGSNVDKWGL